MINEFVPYEESLILKDMGYDKPMSFGRWYACTKAHPTELEIGLTKDTNAKFIAANAERLCIAPLYQQAFKFFREKYGLASYRLQTNKYGKSYYSIKKIETEDTIKGYSGFNDTYAEAELTCLRTLFELTKEIK